MSEADEASVQCVVASVPLSKRPVRCIWRRKRSLLTWLSVQCDSTIGMPAM